MAMSLSADDEDYDSDSEQVSTLKALQAGVRRPPEECLCETEQCAASQGSEVMEIPEDKSTDSVYLLCLGFDFFILFFLPLFLFFCFFFVVDLLFMRACMLAFLLSDKSSNRSFCLCSSRLLLVV